MKKNEMYRISTFIGYKDKKYEVVKFINKLDNSLVYGAIEHKYLTNGKLNQTLNGLQMKVTKSLEDLIESLKFSAEIEEIKDVLGCDLMTAFEIYDEKHADEIDA